jgi:hypothetical protein
MTVLRAVSLQKADIFHIVEKNFSVSVRVGISERLDEHIEHAHEFSANNRFRPVRKRFARSILFMRTLCAKWSEGARWVIEKSLTPLRQAGSVGRNRLVYTAEQAGNGTSL